MEISHPRRILAVSPPNAGLLDLITGLTGVSPTLTTDTIAGTTHNYPISTAYYTARIPIWLDEISSPPLWASEFLAPEAREVLTVLGALIVCFRKPVDESAFQDVRELLAGVERVVREGCGGSWDGVCLAVGMPQSTTPYLEKSFEQWEGVCRGFGFEFVDFEAKGRNEFSEPIGLERLKEALESNDWEGANQLGEDFTLDDLDDDEDEDGEGSIGFDIDPAEMEEEMAGMKRAIYGGGLGLEEDETEQDEEVEKLQAMMLKMQAVRDMGSDLPEAERKKLAAKAVGEIMKTL